MAPTVFREGAFASFSFHGKSHAFTYMWHTDGEAKFWLEPTIELALSKGLNSKQTNEALLLVEQHREEILNAWQTHFGQ